MSSNCGEWRMDKFSSSDKEIEEKDSHPHKLCPKKSVEEKFKKIMESEKR